MKLEQFAYYMVRIRQDLGGGGDVVTGVVERLATGEKRSFATAAELLQAVRDWPGHPSNVPAVPADGQNDEA